MATLTYTRNGKNAVSTLPLANVRYDAITALSRHGDNVRSELAIIGSMSDAYRNRHALVFGIYSPQAAFGPNARIVPYVIAYVMSGGRDWQHLDAICKREGYAMLNNNNRDKTALVGDDKHHAVITLADHIVAGTLPTFAELLAVRGIASKVASMIHALADEYARVITLDTWMLGGMVESGPILRKVQQNTHTIRCERAYQIVADALLDVADSLNVSPFLLQWSLWCYYRNDTFESHLPVFGR